MTTKYEKLAQKALALGASEAKPMRTDQVVFDPRSFLKCRFGCDRWGKYWTCPPHMDISEEKFMAAFDRYENAIVLQCTDPKVGQKVTLAIEKEAMLNHGAMFAMALVLCVKCDPCAYPEPCHFPHLARPSMDAYGIDIEKTVEPLGFKVNFDAEGSLLPAWYSMVLID